MFLIESNVQQIDLGAASFGGFFIAIAHSFVQSYSSMITQLTF